MTSITTPALLRAEAARTGFTQEQLVRIVAKSALIRHVALGRDGRDFVLKGGTLLHHVYGSPRFSIIDADFTHRRATGVDGELLSAALSVAEDDLVIDFSDVEWLLDQAIWRAEAVAYTVGGAVLVGSRQGMNVTVSVRLGEWMDPQERVTYSDPMLATATTFLVNGLTREELAAEKILAWCSKQLVKHAVDLACLARDHATLIDADKAIALTRRKFDIEGGMDRYKKNGMNSFDDLAGALLGAGAARQLSAQWDASGLLIPLSEQAKPDEETLRKRENIERFLREFWLPKLRSARRIVP